MLSLYKNGRLPLTLEGQGEIVVIGWSSLPLSLSEFITNIYPLRLIVLAIPIIYPVN